MDLILVFEIQKHKEDTLLGFEFIKEEDTFDVVLPGESMQPIEKLLVKRGNGELRDRNYESKPRQKSADDSPYNVPDTIKLENSATKLHCSLFS